MFNFETVHPIADAAFEKELIDRQVTERMADAPVSPELNSDVLDLVVSVFRDLRTGMTADGASVAVPNSVMSTAEAVNVTHAAALEAAYLDDGTMTAGHIARQLGGTVFKDDPEDARKLRAYVDQIAKPRGRTSRTWSAFYKSAKDGLRD